MELIFFTGYHGSGKTYTANQLISDGFDAILFDCGPVIRETFTKSGVSDFGEWVRQQEIEFGEKWDNILLLEAIQTTIAKATKKPKRLFVVGNRSLETIHFFMERLSEGGVDKILFFERPFAVMKSGYEARIGNTFTNEEFSAVLHRDEDMGLFQIKAHIQSNPKIGAIIMSDSYDLDSIRSAGRTILGMQVKTKGIVITIGGTE